MHFAILEDDKRLSNVLHDHFEHVFLLSSLQEIIDRVNIYLLHHSHYVSHHKVPHNKLTYEVFNAIMDKKAQSYESRPIKHVQPVHDVSAKRGFKRVEQNYLCEEHAVCLNYNVYVIAAALCLAFCLALLLALFLFMVNVRQHQPKAHS